MDPAASDQLSRVATGAGAAALLRFCSIEVTSREPKTLAACPDYLEPGSEVYITWIPGDAPEHSVIAAATLRRSGLAPTPHIGARHLQSAAQLDELLRRLTGESGVDQVLLIGGDRYRPARSIPACR